jgi:uracil phosphoribosyltransferase
MPEALNVVEHPVLADRLVVLRDRATPHGAFRRALEEASAILAIEATRDLPTRDVTVDTPLEPANGDRLLGEVAIVPVLRAGLGMADAALALLPESSMGFVGLARDEHTFEPRAYMESLPTDLTGLPVLVLDPMLATGGSLEHCCRLLASRGCTDIIVCCALAAPAGIDRIEQSGLPIRLITASIDRELNDRMFIVPGLGDAGDRQFGGMPRF